MFRLLLVCLILSPVAALHAAPPSCGKECASRSRYKPNCVASGCQCGDKCRCTAARKCCKACQCSNGAWDALDQLNAQRASKGLPPYIRDEGLTAGALNVAKFRAERLIQGHTAMDFSGLPNGVRASGAGCAAWPESMGFGACFAYEKRARTAGAASCRGRNGLIFHHLFVK